MTSSLVGSEMCIRDSRNFDQNDVVEEVTTALLCTTCGVQQRGPRFVAVSYTHLTLPTICSV
eukprot:3919582-Prorocentrum_lima.AAC.1